MITGNCISLSTVCWYRCTNGWTSKHYLFPEIRTIEEQLPAETIICIASLRTLLNAQFSERYMLFVLFYIWMCAFDVYITHRKAISTIVSGLEPRALQTTAVVLKLPSTRLIVSFRTTIFYLFRFQNILRLHCFQYLKLWLKIQIFHRDKNRMNFLHLKPAAVAHALRSNALYIEIKSRNMIGLQNSMTVFRLSPFINC